MFTVEGEKDGVDDSSFVHPSCNHIKVGTETEQTARNVTWYLDNDHQWKLKLLGEKLMGNFVIKGPQ